MRLDVLFWYVEAGVRPRDLSSLENEPYPHGYPRDLVIEDLWEENARVRGERDEAREAVKALQKQNDQLRSRT